MLRVVLTQAVVWLAWTGPALGHEEKGGDWPRYEGPGYTAGVGGGGGSGGSGGGPALDFQSRGVNLMAWLPLPDFDSAVGRASERANDIWAYASPTGREYAIIGLERGVAFVDVTTPSSPQIVAGFAGPATGWRDIKTFGSYAYVVADDNATNDANDIQVFDLSQIDSGTVSLANTVTTGRTHNVAIDTASGYLYRTGGADGDARGLTIYDLNADPVNPPQVGQWRDRYVHDAQAVTVTTGPNAGKQVVFAYAENTLTGGNPRLDILDVTDKSNIQVLGQAAYSNNRYSHQGWLSPDGRYAYLNDEFDEQNDSDVVSTTTRIFDVTDLSQPVEVGTFTNGNTAVDHNLYTRGNLIFEANYRSGLRVFDATNPLSPVEVAFFDTFPNSDSTQLNGLWGNTPFLPSGTVLGSDISNGLFIWQVNPTPAVAWDRVNAGDWGSANNWSSRQTPGVDDVVLIATSQDLTVTGPTVDTQVYSLSLSSTSGGVPTLELQPGVTLSVEHKLIIDGASRLTGSGTVEGQVLGATRDSRIEATPGGSLTLGDLSTRDGFRNLGTLVVGSATVTLLDNNAAHPGRTVTLAGGTLATVNDLQLLNNDELRGFGTVEGFIRAQANATVTAEGVGLTLGDPNFPSSLRFMNGVLDVGSSRIDLLESNVVELNAMAVTLGSGGVLASPTGLELPQLKTLDASQATNGARIEGSLHNLGQVTGPAGGAFGGASGGELVFDGDVSGDGSYSGRIRLNGLFNPGIAPIGSTLSSTVTTLFDGDLSLGASARLRLEVGPTQRDLVTVMGVLALDGTVTVELVNGYSPTIGTTLTLITADQLTGDLNGFEGDVYALDDDLAMAPIVDTNANRVILKVTVPGDTNGDLRVDSEDLNTLALNWQSNDSDWVEADFNGDRLVDAVDLNLMALNWQFGVLPGTGNSATDLLPFDQAFADALATTAVPQPTALGLWLAFTMWGGGRARWKRV